MNKDFNPCSYSCDLLSLHIQDQSISRLIQLNCEDLDNTIKIVHATQDDYMEDPQSFGGLLEDVEKPFYLGSLKFFRFTSNVR